MDTKRQGAKGEAEAAGGIAVEALTFLAGDPVLLKRFLDLSGLEPHDIRAASSGPTFFADLLDFFLADERSLLSFSEAAGIAPERVVAARAKLGRERGEAF